MCQGAAEGSSKCFADSASTEQRGMGEGTRHLLTLQEGPTRHSSKHSLSCFSSIVCISIIGRGGSARLAMILRFCYCIEKAAAHR